MDNAVSAVTGRSDARATINAKLSDEDLCQIFMTLALLDIPSLERPQGWFLQVNSVCRRWRYVALGYAELWAISAGSFPSKVMTNLTIERARRSALRFDGHFEDHAGPGYVLTHYQQSLLEKYGDRLRSVVHDDYQDWSVLLYRLGTLPRLEMARIWDDSDSNAWDGDVVIHAPRLQGLYMNNVLIPFSAPSLRSLRVDFNQSNQSVPPDEPADDPEYQPIPTMFPTRKLIGFLQHSPLLEKLVLTGMGQLPAFNLPPVEDLSVALPRLQSLDFSEAFTAMEDLLNRLQFPPETQMSIWHTGPQDNDTNSVFSFDEDQA
ncbi:unnamed protein product [Peniophora sp. CBMAI 1063]|nr:unnamed protein product [Peniophora sp. CBMAI 1063]